jgi:site-specific recombinase XerD
LGFDATAPPTHLLEPGVGARVIQDSPGHRIIATTTRYARVAVNTIRQEAHNDAIQELIFTSRNV